jgi:hypothetical protein
VKDGPTDLPGVLSEITPALLANDWTRYSDDEARFYYVVRESDHNWEVTQSKGFPHLQGLPARPTGPFRGLVRSREPGR